MATSYRIIGSFEAHDYGSLGGFARNFIMAAPSEADTIVLIRLDPAADLTNEITDFPGIKLNTVTVTREAGAVQLHRVYAVAWRVMRSNAEAVAAGTFTLDIAALPGIGTRVYAETAGAAAYGAGVLPETHPVGVGCDMHLEGIATTGSSEINGTFITGSNLVCDIILIGRSTADPMS